MKRLLAIIVTLASGFVLSASAQNPATAAPTGPVKIAVIAFQAAVAQTNEGLRNFSDLQKKYEPKRQQLRALAEEIDNMTKQLQAQGDKLSPTEQQARAKALDDKKKQLDRSAEDAQNDFQTEMQEIYNGLAAKVYDVLANYSQQQGYTVVFDVTGSQQQAPVVLWASPSTDITKQIIEAYNLKSGVPPPPAPPAAAPATKPVAKPVAKPPAN
ncbi:MAG TPA: OmpH family outer membrane protein [Terracidiphilus sp.]|nr:OmpH family outer membrane protein [Terracidiphilus sp.]